MTETPSIKGYRIVGKSEYEHSLFNDHMFTIKMDHHSVTMFIIRDNILLITYAQTFIYGIEKILKKLGLRLKEDKI